MNKPVVNKAIALVPVVLLTASGCAVGARASAPTCGSAERLALLAQSVPTAAYVPCLHALPQGWSVTRAQAARGSARIVLLSDRRDGHSVDVRLSAGCDVTGSTAAVPHADGVACVNKTRCAGV